MKRILIVLSFTSLFLSCERDVLYEGPSIETMLGPFELIQKFEVSNQNVDFYNGETTFFTAEFSSSQFIHSLVVGWVPVPKPVPGFIITFLIFGSLIVFQGGEMRNVFEI